MTKRVLMECRETHIEPRSASAWSFAELWKYRYLFHYFAGHFIRARYRGTVLGWFWLLLGTLVPAGISTLVFGNLLSVPSNNVPYLLFFLTGASLWNFFSNSLVGVTRSLSTNSKMITKLYFPRIIIPLTSFAPHFIQFCISILMVLAVSLAYAFSQGKSYVILGPQLGFSIVFVFMSALLALGIGLWTCVFSAGMRDVRFTMRYAIQLWSYLTPVIYPVSLIPERWRFLAMLNPMTVIMEGFKWSVLGRGHFELSSLLFSAFFIILVFVSATCFFYESQAKIVDNL